MSEELVEIAKHLGRPIDTACKLIENILSEPTKKLGDLLGDQVSYWQWTNRFRIAERAVKLMAQRGREARKLPLDFIVPFLRDSGDTENPDLQEWWAELLASAVVDDSACHVAFIGLLKGMSATDARFLDTLIQSGHAEMKGRIEAIAQTSGLSPAQATISFHNLERLGFFTPTGKRLKGIAFDFLTACYPQRDKIASYREIQSKLGKGFVMD